MNRRKIFEESGRCQILEQYYKTVGRNSALARKLIMKLNYRNDAYLLRCIALTYFNESLFNDDDTYKENFDGRKLRLAEEYIIDAYNLNENCIDVLYTMGKIRNAFKQTDLAIYCYKRIIEIGKRKIAQKDNCTNRSLVQINVNDSRFQLYRLYHDKGDSGRSKLYLTLYKKGLSKGIATIYKPIEKYLMD